MARRWPFKLSRSSARRRALPFWATTERLRHFAREGNGVAGYFAMQDMLVWDAFLEFQEREGVTGHMLEIGVLKGRSALLSSLYAGPKEHCWFLDVAMDRDFSRILEARMPHSVHFVERSSYDVRKELAETFTGIGDFRWIHIDGQHTATAVVNDLEIADRLLADRGLVAMDDFLSPSTLR